MIYNLSLIAILTFVPLLPDSAWALDFESDIQPILKKKCFKCHSGPKAKKGLRWDKKEVVAEWIKEGTDSVIVPGSPVKSLMFIKTSQGRQNHPDGMPPLRRGTPLSEGELKLVAKWITEGAKVTSSEEDDSTVKMKKEDEVKIYDWTNLSGQTIKAGFVRLEDKSVVLRLESGKDTTYPMGKLSVESRELAKKLAEGK